MYYILFVYIICGYQIYVSYIEVLSSIQTIDFLSTFISFEISAYDIPMKNYIFLPLNHIPKYIFLLNCSFINHRYGKSAPYLHAKNNV